MILRILIPTKVLIEKTIDKIVAEGKNGYFCLLPNHVDFVSALAPGVLSYFDEEGEHYVAVDQGILVKTGDEVLVSTRRGIPGTSLEKLDREIEKTFKSVDEKEKTADMAIRKLEAGVIRKFMEIGT